jgi:hypothetical protein
MSSLASSLPLLWALFTTLYLVGNKKDGLAFHLNCKGLSMTIEAEIANLSR